MLTLTIELLDRWQCSKRLMLAGAWKLAQFK